MSKSIAACRINGEEVHFILRPKPEQPDGFVKKPDGDQPVDFWSFVTHFPDIEIIDNTEYLKEMWYGDTDSKEWEKEYLFHGEEPPKRPKS
jgi:hypothetical protein